MNTIIVIFNNRTKSGGLVGKFFCDHKTETDADNCMFCAGMHGVHEADALLQMLGVEFRYTEYLEFLKSPLPSRVKIMVYNVGAAKDTQIPYAKKSASRRKKAGKPVVLCG